MNEVVNFHNDLVDLPLKNFNASEIDILVAICHECQDKECNSIKLKFDDIKKLAAYKNYSQFIENFINTNKKLLNLNFKLENEDKIVQFALFPTFVIDKKNEILEVRVNEPFSYLLNELTGNYTPLELQQSSNLKSTYAKQIFKKLKRFKDTGKWIVSLDDFKKYLDIPKSYKIGQISTKVLVPSIKELSPYFIGLACDPITKKSSSGRGRPSVVGYEFSFQQEIKEKYKNMDTLATSTDWKKIDKYCPICHKEVYSKQLQNDNGTYYILGHPDFKTGSCNWTSTSWSEVLSQDQINNAQNENDKLESTTLLAFFSKKKIKR